MRLNTKRFALLLAAAGMAVTLTGALSGAARADTNSVMTTCSAQYKVDKAAGKVPANQTWPQYYSTCAANQKAAGTTATTTAPAASSTTTAPAASPTTTTAKTTTAPATSTTTAKTTTAPAASTTTADTSNANTTMATCSAQYKVDKAAGKVPATQTWPQYYSACAAALKASASTTDAADATPPEPAATATTAKVSTTDANGKTLTPGQIAAQSRIKQCGAMWTADKAANKIPTGQTWPQYWSACNTKLKAAGN